MNSVLPHFINKKFILRALTHERNDKNVEILNFNGELAIISGENYYSDIYRIKVIYNSNESQEKTVELIVKHVKKNLVAEYTLKNKEFFMYDEILPKMENILHKEVKFVPKCYLVMQEGEEAFVFEDLNAKGYKLADRVSGLNEEYSKLVMKKIGVFHAISMVLIDLHPEYKKNLNDPLLKDGTRNSESLRKYILGNLIFAVKTVAQWNGFEEIANKLRKISENFDDKIGRTFDPTISQFNVINHGDLWVNNILFRYENNSPTDVAFIDFQIPFYGSPGHDLNFFLNTSVQLEILQTKRYELLRDYFQSLTETLKRYNYSEMKIPTWQMLVHEIRRTEFFGMYAVLVEFPFMALTKEI